MPTPKPQRNAPSASSLEKAASLAAKRAASIICRYYETGLRPEYKGDVNLVTRADREAQDAILHTLQKAFPTHKMLAEEDASSHDQLLEGPHWIIDPLDGTTNFTHGYPMFGVSIAFREGKELRFGLVYHPLLKEMFIAHKGRGASLNGRKIRVSQKKTLTESLVATGFPYDRRESANNNLSLFCRFELLANCVRRGGSAAIDLAYVACGRLDGLWEPKLAPWDIAAGTLIVQEAGGKVTTYAGGPLHDLWCGEIVGSNRLIHREMIDIIATTKESITLGKAGNLLSEPGSIPNIVR